MASAIATLVQNGIDIGVIVAPRVSDFLLGVYQTIVHVRRHFRMEHECIGFDGSVTYVFGVPEALGNLISDWVLLQQDLVSKRSFLQSVVHEVESESGCQATTNIRIQPDR